MRDRSACVTLKSRKPPGRLSRKALEFEPEIRRLHFDGHTSEAIRQALLDAGLAVSRSTVKREVARLAKRRPVDESRDTAVSRPSEQPAPRPLAPTPSHPLRQRPAQQQGDRRVLRQEPPHQPPPAGKEHPSMKVAVINFSGNVGKTTIARHLLVRRWSSSAIDSRPLRLPEPVDEDLPQRRLQHTHLPTRLATGRTAGSRL